MTPGLIIMTHKNNPVAPSLKRDFAVSDPLINVGKGKMQIVCHSIGIEKLEWHRQNWFQQPDF